MPRSSVERKAIHKFFLSVIAGPDGAKLTAAAEKAVPRKGPKTVQGGLTQGQRDWLKKKITAEHWNNLSSTDKESWVAAASGTDAPPVPAVRIELSEVTAPEVEEEVSEPETLLASSSKGPSSEVNTSKRKTEIHMTDSMEEESKKPRFQPVSEVGAKTLYRHTKHIADFLQGFSSAEDAATVLSQAIQNRQLQWPDFAQTLLRKLNKKAQLDRKTDCATCSALLPGLAASPGFSAAVPAEPVRKVRDHVDRLVRNSVGDQTICRSMGYPMGDTRWRRAGNAADTDVNRGGRPSKVDNPECIEAVRAALQKCSQDSSKICRDASGEWQVARTLTKDKASIYHNEEEVNKQMGDRTFQRILKRHLCQFKKARSSSDMCQHCVDYDDKVLPMMNKTLAEQRQQLEELLPHYFNAWDTYLSSTDVVDRPAQHLEELEHYVAHHENRQPCSKHRGTAYPCGQRHLRTRESGFPQRRRVDLHSMEAACALELRSLLKLVLSYNHHKAANEHQSPCLMELQVSPPLASIGIISDWKELVSLPISHRATGEQFYATARMEISVWGCCVIKHLQANVVEREFFLVISDILDHTCLRTNVLIDMILDRCCKNKTFSSIILISDPGPHYRGYEALYFYLVSLVCKWKAQVTVHWGCEKHSKSICDKLFGWFSAYIEKAKQNKQEILSLEDLKKVVERENSEQRLRDPSSPKINVILDTTSPVPKKAYRLLPAHFHITRSYCLSARLDTRVKPQSLGVRVYNHVFSTKPVAIELDEFTVESVTPPAMWRRGFWGDGKTNWMTNPTALGRHDHTGLSRKYDAQTSLLPEGRTRKHGQGPSIAEELSKRMSRLDRRRERNQAKRLALARKLRRESSSGSSSSSSDSSSD